VRNFKQLAAFDINLFLSSKTSLHQNSTQTNTHNRFAAVWILSGQSGRASTRRNTHCANSHLAWSLVISYLLPPYVMMYGILPVQFMCLTVFFHNLCPRFLWSTSWPGTLHFILLTFLHPVIVFFSQHIPISHTIATCFAVVPSLCHLILVSLPFLYLEL